jgi:hypothetical protein
MEEWGNEWQLTHPTHSILDAAPDGCFGASSPIRRIVSHRLQSADSGHSPSRD